MQVMRVISTLASSHICALIWIGWLDKAVYLVKCWYSPENVWVLSLLDIVWVIIARWIYRSHRLILIISTVISACSHFYVIVKSQWVCKLACSLVIVFNLIFFLLRNSLKFGLQILTHTTWYESVHQLFIAFASW